MQIEIERSYPYKRKAGEIKSRLHSLKIYFLQYTYPNAAACTPITPAIAPATAIITFKIKLQVLFIEILLFKLNIHLYPADKRQLTLINHLSGRIRCFTATIAFISTAFITAIIRILGIFGRHIHFGLFQIIIQTDQV